MSLEDRMRENALAEDKKDLLEVLKTRFGSVTEEVERKIAEITELDVMDRLFLVAVNSSTWEVFVKELYEGKTSFKIIGEDFNPLAERQDRKE